MKITDFDDVLNHHRERILLGDGETMINGNSVTSEDIVIDMLNTKGGKEEILELLVMMMIGGPSDFQSTSERLRECLISRMEEQLLKHLNDQEQ
jgi:hypothetical protein